MLISFINENSVKHGHRKYWNIKSLQFNRLMMEINKIALPYYMVASEGKAFS